MRSAWYLAWAYTRAHLGRSSLMIAALGLLLLLPVSIALLVQTYDARLGARAQATPVVVGARGNRYDLVLQALLFRDGRTDDVRYAWVRRINDDKVYDATAVPLHARHTAQGVPVVGTDVPIYQRLRKLSLAQGNSPQILGEAVLGSAAAKTLGLGVGDTLTTDRVNLYDLSRTMPLRMRIVGVFESTGTVDDNAVFVDVRTTWVIAGLGHGHDPAAHADAAQHSAAVNEVMITKENAHLFHFHRDEDDMPLSAVLVWPMTDKDRTLMLSRINGQPTVQALVPARVMDELMGLVLRIKRLFDANALLVGVSVALLIGLVVALSLKLREAERRTLHKLGCARWLVVQMLTAEMLIVLGGAVVLAGLGAGGVWLMAPKLLGV